MFFTKQRRDILSPSNIWLFLLALILVGSFSFTNTGYARESSELEAEQVVQQFLSAMKNGEYNKALGSVIDNRYASFDKQIKDYLNFIDSENLLSWSIKSVDIENNNSLFVNLKKSPDSKVSLAINVKKINDSWKIVMEDDESKFSTKTLADHYSFDGFLYGAHYTINTFSLPSGVDRVVVQGWQYSANSYPSEVSYQIAQKVTLGYKTYGDAVNVSGDGEFTKTLSGATSASSQNGFCIRIFIGNSAVVNGAGNVMYNP